MSSTLVKTMGFSSSETGQANFRKIPTRSGLHVVIAETFPSVGPTDNYMTTVKDRCIFSFFTTLNP